MPMTASTIGSPQEIMMAKGQKRSTREAKKPKADKKKPATISSPFTEPPSKKKSAAE
jgi:hypothetical protein